MMTFEKIRNLSILALTGLVAGAIYLFLHYGSRAVATFPVMRDGIEVTEINVGDGAQAEVGQSIQVHYIGKLTDGKVFDNSIERNQPFKFTLGKGEVIQGWDKGISGMKEGGTRRLVIPASLGYGAQGSPPAIPPNATLVFDVTLIKVN